MSRIAPLVAALGLAACRQATPAEVGAHAQAGAFPNATMKASEHASAAAPGTVPAMARGTPMRQPAAR